MLLRSVGIACCILVAWCHLSAMGYAQEGAGGDEAPAPAATQQDAQSDASPFGNLTFLLIPAALVLFMMLVMRPQQKDQSKREEMLKSLKKNDRVVTAGGIVAKVQNINVDQKTVKLMLDEKTGSTMTVTQEAISRIMTAEDKTADAKDESK